MSYEELSLSGFIDEIKHVSKGPHSRKFCFVLGAGASKSSGIKSGQELVSIWDKELLKRNGDEHTKWKNRLGITDNNMDSFYSQYYERRFRRQPADGYNYLEKLMENAKPSIGYVMLAYLLSETKNNVVITTNFDHLAEDAVNYYTQTIPLVIGHETLAHYISRQINRPTIIKIHRDLLFDPKNRTDELEILHDNWKKALGSVFAEYHPIFIGYAGNDKSLMNFLIENSDKFCNDEWAFPYWMIYKTENVGGKVLEFLEKSNGYLTRHSGFDEVLYLLGAAFDYKLPSKENFLSDAEKRFQTLSDYVDEFTEKLMSKNEEFRDENNVVDKNEEIDQAIQQITNQNELQRMYREAVVLHNEGKLDEALQIKEKLVKMEPTNARYYNSYGRTLHNLGRYNEALEAKRKAIELETDNAEYYNNYGVTLNRIENYEKALEVIKKAIELEPENAIYYDSYARTLYNMGCYDEALEAVRKAIELEEDIADYYDDYGCILYEMGRYDEALEAVRKAIELEEDIADYYDDYGSILYEMGRYDEALEAVKKAMELEPDNPEYQETYDKVMDQLV